MSNHTEELEILMKQYVQLHTEMIAAADGAIRYADQMNKAKELHQELLKKMREVGAQLKAKIDGEEPCQANQNVPESTNAKS